MSRMLRLRGASPLVLALTSLLVAHSDSVACSYSANRIEVGASFSLRVMNGSNPVVGLRIELSTDPKEPDKDSESILILKTNENGVTTFTDVKPGTYFVGIKNRAFPYSKEILVRDDTSKKTSERIEFDWPGVEVLSVQSAAGLLNGQLRIDNPINDQIHPVYGAIPNAKLTLSEAASGAVIETRTASESGAFEFHPLPDGLYLLFVELSYSDLQHYRSAGQGYIPIEIDRRGKANSLNLFLSPGICGSLGYENRE